MRAHSLALLALFVLVAGCMDHVGHAGDAKANIAVSSDAPLGRGDLKGIVTDTESRPVAGARVRAEGPDDSGEVLTDAEGSYYFAQLVAGAHVLTFDHPRYGPARQVVYLAADAVNSQDVSLELLPSYRPYHTILPAMNGHYTCGSETFIFTGDCMILWEFATKQPDTLTTETYDFRLPVSAGWNQVVAQLAWDESANNQLDGMHLYLSPGNESQDLGDHHTKLAVAEGPSAPLRLDVVSGTPGPGAEPYPGSSKPAEIPAAGMNLLALVYPRGNGAETMAQVCEPGTQKCFLGAGAGLDVTFTLYAAVFYNGDPVPATFTMLPP